MIPRDGEVGAEVAQGDATGTLVTVTPPVLPAEGVLMEKPLWGAQTNRFWGYGGCWEQCGEHAVGAKRNTQPRSRGTQVA